MTVLMVKCFPFCIFKFKVNLIESVAMIPLIILHQQSSDRCGVKQFKLNPPGSVGLIPGKDFLSQLDIQVKDSNRFYIDHIFHLSFIKELAHGVRYKHCLRAFSFLSFL